MDIDAELAKLEEEEEDGQGEKKKAKPPPPAPANTRTSKLSSTVDTTGTRCAFMFYCSYRSCSVLYILLYCVMRCAGMSEVERGRRAEAEKVKGNEVTTT